MVASGTLAGLAALCATGLAAPFSHRGQAANSSQPLPNYNTAAKANGKLWFGSAIDTLSSEYQDASYMAIFNDSAIFGQTTPGNTMKWEFVEPTQNTFAFTQGQETVDLAKATGKKLRCHNLVWHEELPNWVTSGTWTNATLLAALENHITKVVQHWGDSCYSWDVVNEAISDSGTWRSDVFYDTIGPAYVPLAFKYARAAAQAIGASPKLFYNDYNLEYAGSKQTFGLDLVKQIQAYGDNIDGVGFESHFIVGETPGVSSQTNAMQSFIDLGLIVHQTEIDVRFSSLPPTTAGLAQQAQDYYNTVAACAKTPKCEGSTVWDFDDAYSWVPSTFSGAGDADLLYANLTAPPAAFAILQAIENQACTSCS